MWLIISLLRKSSSPTTFLFCKFINDARLAGFNRAGDLSGCFISTCFESFSDPFPGYYGFDLYRPLCEDAYDSIETKPSTAYFVSWQI